MIVSSHSSEFLLIATFFCLFDIVIMCMLVNFQASPISDDWMLGVDFLNLTRLFAIVRAFVHSLISSEYCLRSFPHI